MLRIAVNLQVPQLAHCSFRTVRTNLDPNMMLTILRSAQISLSAEAVTAAKAVTMAGVSAIRLRSIQC